MEIEKTNICLVAVNSKFIHSNLALRYLKSYFNKNASSKVLENSNISFVESTINDDLSIVLEDIMSTKPNIVVISTYIWNYAEVKELVRNIKDIDENIIVVSGGPEVSFESKNHVLEMKVDYIIRGEGEKTFLELMEALILNKDVFDIDGIDYRFNDEIISTKSRKLMDMNDVVFPYNKDEIKSLNNKIVYYEASRGCPFQCSYCMSSLDRVVRTLDINRVFKELKFFMEESVPLVKFVDRTFNVNEEFAYKVWEFIIKEKLLNPHYITKFHFEVSGALISDRQVELLNTAPIHLIQLEAGIQTTNKSILLNINRYDSYEKLKHNLSKIIDKKNIHVHIDLIAGLPNEDYKSFKKSFNDCFKLYANMLQLGFLKVLKGTEIYKEIDRWGIKFSSLQPYEVLKTNSISYFELRELKKVEEVLEKYWNSNLYYYSMKMMLKNVTDEFEFFIKLKDELKEYRKRIKVNLNREDYFSLLIKFNEKYSFIEKNALIELLRFDYILSDRKGNIPEVISSKENKKIKYSLNIDMSSSNEYLIKEKNSSSINSNEKVKGNIEYFTLDIKKLIEEEIIEINPTVIFYSLAIRDIYKVNEIIQENEKTKQNIDYKIIEKLDIYK